jgi:hypothetical protein
MVCTHRIPGTQRACNTDFCFQCGSRINSRDVGDHFTRGACFQTFHEDADRERVVVNVRRAVANGRAPLSGKAVSAAVGEAAILSVRSAGGGGQ